ncbi:hypothetical protein ACFQ5J_12925 [Lacticaseibacillus baoqingensis]|uniref:BIG2 domain-containing protein n=1 Tax=Lacticaseibacillus baoqingensis TaxID=2486013 RepID=A0ABW4E896_9LACO|nr:hypothetical protein [Lacticaseibacillus baoqingensis]
MKQLHIKTLGIWLLLVLGLAGIIAPVLPVHADIAGSITPPSIQTVPAGSEENFLKPAATGGANQFTSPLNWMATTSTLPDGQYAVKVSGQSVTVKAAFNYQGTGDPYYQTVWYQPGAPLQMSGTGPVQGSAVLSNAMPLDFGSTDYKNIQYKLTAPDVTKPTWVYFQVRIHDGAGNPQAYTPSTIFPMLVLPTNFQLGVTLSPRVVFPGSTITAQLNNGNLPANVVPSLSTTATNGAGSWSQNTFTATGAGVVQAMYAFSLPVPIPVNGASPTTYLQSGTAYIGQIDDQTVEAGSDAAFKIVLPSGLTAQNIRWTLAGASVTGNSTTMTVPKVKASQDKALVTATMDVAKGGTVIQQNVVGTAHLYIKQPPLAVKVASPLLFSGDKVDSDSQVTTASATYQGAPATGVTWSVDDPSLATVNATTGVLTANPNGKTGTVMVTGKKTTDGTAVSQSVPVTIGHLPDLQPLAAGDSFTLTAPPAPAGSNWTYQWQQSTTSGNAWQNLANGTGAAYTATAQAADDQTQYRVAVTTAAGNVVKSNPTTLTVNAAGLNLLQVPDFTFKVAQPGQTAAQMSDPTVADLITGKYSGTASITDPAVFNKWLLATAPATVMVSDSRGPNATFSLAVALAPFKNGSSYLNGAAGGSATLSLNWANAQGQMQEAQIKDDNVPVTALDQVSVNPTTGRMSLPLEPLLATGKAPQAKAGQYHSAVTWTVTAGPSGD